MLSKSSSVSSSLPFSSRVAPKKLKSQNEETRLDFNLPEESYKLLSILVSTPTVIVARRTVFLIKTKPASIRERLTQTDHHSALYVVRDKRYLETAKG
jgi:hypothetical protein